ncbi:MAG: efflux RND transporter periplasmic adaptor subunit [Treponema sp.]|nr:efflux RND transporter periplasmic adaptor subunit [Treponema sp.]
MNFFSLVLIAVLPCACFGAKTKPVTYEFTVIRRGTLERTASASGTINPVASIKVLSRMNGKVEKVYVDYNDTVKAGDVLAELNTDMLKLKREQQQAALIKARANYELQLINYNDQEALARKDFISEYELKTSLTMLENLRADLRVAEANLKAIETEINQYAYITSPIDGIVLDRNVNVGDTVVESSSSNSASIFTLAENLREMQIEAAVGQLDVVSLYRGQAVRFTLESLPGRNFTGTVENIRMIPVVSNNVVSYTVIIGVENHEGVLLPGMICAVNFIVEQRENVLLVPNAALRYQPSTLNKEQIDEKVFIAGLALMDDDQRRAAIEAREQAHQPGQNANTGLARLVAGNQRPRPPPQHAGEGSRAVMVMRNIWYLNAEGRPEVIRVQTGGNNGSLTEILSTEDLEGKQVILRERLF